MSDAIGIFALCQACGVFMEAYLRTTGRSDRPIDRLKKPRCLRCGKPLTTTTTTTNSRRPT